MEILNINGFSPVTQDEAIRTVGGIDKGAQETLYLLGYVVGIIAKLITSLFSLGKVAR